MSKKDFDDFISVQDAPTDDNEAIDWSRERDEWLQYLDKFYETVMKFMQEYIDAGKIKYEFFKKEVFEEYIGSYVVQKLEINLAGHNLKFEPVGTNLIGAKGRVDLYGGNGKIRFVLVDKDLSAPSIKMTVRIVGEETPACTASEFSETTWAWKIATPPPQIRYIDLTQDAFLDAVMKVING